MNHYPTPDELAEDPSLLISSDDWDRAGDPDDFLSAKERAELEAAFEAQAALEETESA